MESSTTQQDNSISTPVAKTALDALTAKISATHLGYNPIRTDHNGDLYNHFLNEMRLGLERRNESATEDDCHSSKCIKRQSPLVNAGYALRVASLSRMVYEFIHCHKNNDRKLIPPQSNVVIIGCGFDVMGLWAGSFHVNIYEVDCAENCILKWQSMLHRKLISPTVGLTADKGMNDEKKCLLQGRLIRPMQEQNNEVTNDEEKVNDDKDPNYTLMSADLRCISSLQEAFLKSSFNSNLPTLVVSELVLAYLGSKSVSELLSFLASNICQHNQSMFIAYEPTSPSVSSNGIVQGYAANYFGQFTSKLNKGNADKKEKNQKHKSQFEPIGQSSSHTIAMIRSCGFDGPVDCKVIALASKNLNLRHVSLSPELFDEHAAFRLHMHCYSVIGAKVSCKRKSDMNAYFKICPWSNIDDATDRMGKSFQIVSPLSSSDDFTLTVVKSEHQEQVRILFTNTYNHLFDQYPSVKKMVKSAIKTDLNTKSVDERNDENKKDEPKLNRDKCSIWDYYSQRGGSFWVVLNNKNDDKVIGCIGVTRMMKDKDSNKPRSYEIHRLAVHPDSRGLGIGKLLLQTVEDFISCKEYLGATVLLATTPEILEAANSLYSSQSYIKEKDVLMGNMNIRTYKKVLQHTIDHSK